MFDAREANYLRYTLKFRYKSKKILGINFKKGFVYGVGNFIVGFIQSLFKNPISFRKLISKSEGNIIFYNGRNQYNALITLYDILKSRNDKVSLIQSSELPMWRSYVYAIGSIGTFCRDYGRSSEEDKRVISNELATYLRSYGDYKLMMKWLDKSKISNLFLANDHVTYMRALLMACNDSNVQTIYVQHAAVTEKFPPLISTYSFLDGQDSLDKYTTNNKLIKSKVYVVGGTRFDLAKPKDVQNNDRLGIALTRSDEKPLWEVLISSLKKNYDKEIVLRPHPRMDLESIKEYCNNNSVIFSDPSKEDSFSFLNNISVLIANETSTHLDAMLMHRPSVLYTGLSSTGLRDHYGMVQKGLLKYCDSFKELQKIIDKPKLLSPQDSQLRLYNASFHTQFEYNVSELIVRIVIDKEDSINGLVEQQGITYIDYGSKG